MGTASSRLPSRNSKELLHHIITTENKSSVYRRDKENVSIQVGETDNWEDKCRDSLTLLCTDGATVT